MIEHLKDILNTFNNQKRFLKDQLYSNNKDMFNIIIDQVYKLDIKIIEYNNLINNNLENNNKNIIQYPNRLNNL